MAKDLPAFEVDIRVHVAIERELAAYIGSLILNSDTKNTAAIAFGHQLKRISVILEKEADIAETAEISLS